MSRTFAVLLAASLFTACAEEDDPPAADAGTSTGDTAGTDGPPSTSAASDDSTSEPATGDASESDDTDDTNDSEDSTETTGTNPENDQELLDRLVGLWVAPVTSWTSVGSFPTMNMDFRRAGETLFGRVDLDANNALRFAFALEEHNGAPVLVYRNGGKFLGLDRDTRTAVVESDAAAGHWRFCSIDRGCEYVDATFDFADEQRFTLAVSVRGMNHILWEATRREERPMGDYIELGDPLPGDGPFPPMPSLQVDLSWEEPLAENADAWVILSTTACGLTANCVPSRFLRVEAEAGATSASLLLEQIHAGSYSANAMLDRNGNLAGTLFPDAGDQVSFPDQPVMVEPTGESQIAIDLRVEL